jgi:antitoxin (DNA-binding transcriptional repressor) of toxin-antitoxin stability system
MKNLEKREQLEVKDLKERIDKLLSLIESGQIVELIDHGKVIAEVVPPTPAVQRDAEAWATLERIASRLAPYWPEGVDAVDIVRDVRRDL